VFNESATRGYICLLSTPGHFDVLQGVHGPPATPRDAHTHGVSRSTFTASTNVWWHLQRKYSYRNVFRFPATFHGVTILNSAVHESTCGPSSNISEGDDDVIPEVQNNMSLSPERTYADVVKGDQNVLRCDFPGCSYSSEKSKSLAMHKWRAHPRNQNATSVVGE